ncbi:hypothetical protein FT663_00790 [Candidozyma haemuli var. vulneris]|uniref:Gfo/Idh/MocA-like oxidoreductase N-terminal domain-containing protein n=1 Tax=Candidozyma haemuli TaxID=45357 RepID=A0A2V1AWR6_9ASCO|nr:hypothetical protein CXQ85_005277 [[Candida] haemuloni]KAF3992880.1 hypothetical protein FT662_00882 [[Candida] haemuloni var. vulneris]KAF3995091.1 hypothetical protein FT663_00790 [[Candida] haemuloni var. vulneris]PVH22252.1 hypothetical protein CXQ85_005277 [[Candida] haemuloni]
MTLNVGIVGTGIFATDNHLPVIKEISNLKPYAAFNRTESKAQAFAEKAGIDKKDVYQNVEDLLDNKSVDFVDALLPVQSNLDLVQKAIKFNKPIVFEKPIAANLQQAKEIVKISESTDLPIGILEQWAFLSAIDKIHDLLPKIGDVVSFIYKSTGPWNEENKYLATGWRQKPEHIGGFLSDGGVHQLALLTEVLGEVDSVSGHTKQIREESGAHDILFSTFKLKSGAIGNFTYGSAFGATEKSTSFTIYGTNGSIVYDFSPALKKPTITYQTGPSAQQASDKNVIEIDEVNAIKKEFENFAEAVEKKDKSIVRVYPRKAFHHLAVIAAALDSSDKDGASIKVEQP